MLLRLRSCKYTQNSPGIEQRPEIPRCTDVRTAGHTNTSTRRHHDGCNRQNTAQHTQGTHTFGNVGTSCAVASSTDRLASARLRWSYLPSHSTNGGQQGDAAWSQRHSSQHTTICHHHSRLITSPGLIGTALNGHLFGTSAWYAGS